MSILLSSFSNSIVCLRFKVNQNNIAKNICELRTQKNNSCNGNCVLRAELKKLTEIERKHDSLLKEKSEIVYTNSVIDYDFSHYIHTTKPKTTICYLSAKPKYEVFAVFHPPIV